VLEFLKKRGKREPGWLAISLQPGRLHFAHGVTAGGKSAITRCGTRAYADDNELERAAKDLGFERYRCLTILPAADYQLLLVDAPNVPATELRNAARWRIKDMLDYSVDKATIDVLDIPADPNAASRAHSMYTVAAKNEVIQSYMERFSRVRIPLSVIDIVETAHRNIAALLEPPDRGVAMLFVEKEQVLFTVTFRGELYLARRFDVGLEELEKLARGGSDDAKNRILLEVQRSFDHLERQFPFVGVGSVVLAPTPADVGLQSYLSENLDIPVQEVRLDEVLSLAPDLELEREAAWRLFHVFGAALRNEATAS
jgi:MSHA biogenesis protein MshI